MGRRSTYTDELASEICAKLEEGENLLAICAADGMPPESTVRLWARDNATFAAMYARARLIGYERMADELAQIADDGANDTYKTDHGIETNHDVIARSRLRVDTRKWILCKMLPKIYGDKVTQELTGANGGPIQTQSTVTVYMPENERDVPETQGR